MIFFVGLTRIATPGWVRRGPPARVAQGGLVEHISVSPDVPRGMQIPYSATVDLAGEYGTYEWVLDTFLEVIWKKRYVQQSQMGKGNEESYKEEGSLEECYLKGHFFGALASLKNTNTKEFARSDNTTIVPITNVISIEMDTTKSRSNEPGTSKSTVQYSEAAIGNLMICQTKRKNEGGQSSTKNKKQCGLQGPFGNNIP
ncbi:hypothetical protein M9H77_04444 [Catharanthus roseus]|uniref:Uncharacterized protein n=1 Tax=Catharanthus roseus TaxID=4058 RepID=A0ACC0CEL4_CATRO|nr:hypothetical protein M9H77_04444 [Catharanthus roseus]